MEVDGSGKKRNVILDPNSKGYDTIISEKSIIRKGNRENNDNSKPVTDAIKLTEDSAYNFNDPKRRRPNETNDTSPICDIDGLPTNLQVAGLTGGVCRES